MTTTDLPGLTFRTLDPAALDDRPEGLQEEASADRALLLGWGEALARGFHEGRTTDEWRAVWLEGARADRMRLSGFWPDTTAVAATSLPVATFASWTGGGLNVGGGAGLTPHLISDVTVSPTHRRRGLLRALMHHDLTDAAARGLALAALTVTEGGIYGRFGFGAATHLRAIQVDVTERFALRSFDDPGSLELVEPAEAVEVLRRLQGEHRRRTRGALDWPAFYEPMISGRFNADDGGPDRKARVVLHLDAAGRPDGFARWSHQGKQDGVRTVEVRDLVCATPGGHLRLWEFLAGIDLTQRIVWDRAPLVDPLEWALVDARCVTTTRISDLLWVRVLDVVAALEARPWYADGSVVLEISDPLDLIDGRWRVDVRDGAAAVSRTEDPAQVSLTAETLGSLYLGGVDTATLHAAGRLAGDAEAIERWARLADGGPAPYCTTGF